MAKTRRAYTGAAVSTTTASSIAASGTTSFTITAYTGWPYGTDPFYIVVEPGTASEEKILVTRTGSTDTTINIASDSVRGLDGTSAVAHNTGSTVFPVFTALDADEANELASKWSAKGDLVSYGSSTFEKLGVGSNGQFLRAASGETSGLKWETFNNTLGSGSAVRTLGTFVGGDVLQAAELNTIGTWTAYTPTFTNLTVGNATVAFKYSVINKIVFVEGLLTLGSTSSVGTEPFFTLPVNRAISTLSQIGVGTYADVGTATYMAYVLNLAASNRCYLYALNAGGAGGLAELTVTNAVPFTWANGDRIQVSIRYEAA